MRAPGPHRTSPARIRAAIADGDALGSRGGHRRPSSPGDPLPLRWTIPICLTPALLGWVSLQGGPMVVELSEGWGRSIGVPLLCFMCVLGRTRYAWPGFLAVVAVFAIHYAHSIGPLAGAARCLTDGAVLAIATVFAVTIRPTAQTIFALRAAGARRAAEVAAREATAIERDSQLSELDTLARPLLARIASGAALSAAERLQCELLDAELRDRLRAPGLHSAAVAAAAARARARGVGRATGTHQGIAARPRPARRTRRSRRTLTPGPRWWATCVPSGQLHPGRLRTRPDS
ncbi:hypothetical protein KIK15_04090 [Williamsia sp. CHRR-6]|nr:hypothetical protein [Williamsia sp. CHRR-6]